MFEVLSSMLQVLTGLVTGLFFYTSAHPNIVQLAPTSTLTITETRNEQIQIPHFVFKSEPQKDFVEDQESIIQDSVEEFSDESIVNSSIESDGIVPEQKTDEEIILTAEPIAPSSTSTTPSESSGDGYASNPAIYAPKDVAPVDPTGVHYAEWLAASWKNLPNKIPDEELAAIPMPQPEAILEETALNIIIPTEETVTSPPQRDSPSGSTPPDNQTATSTSTSTIVTARNLHVVISQIKIGSASSTLDEFIELYNPTTSTIFLSDWKLRRTTASGKTADYLINSFPSDAVILPINYILIAHPSGFSSTTSFVPDFWYTGSSSIAPSNTVSLIDQSGAIVDLVGYGEASIFEQAPAHDLKNDGHALRRHLESEIIDTDNNALDFFVDIAS